jgi:Tfp pilus assembly protein PilN
MRAVNLIPADLRRAGSAGGRSGTGTFVVLGALALLVAMVTLLTLANRTVADKQARVTVVEQQAAAAESRTANLKAYTEFSALSKQRTETVKSLAASRFEWAHAMSDVARVLPSNAWLSSIRATVTPGASVDGAADPLRQALAVPAIELAGCTTSQANVARIVANLRAADGVKRVSLSSASKSEVATGSSNTTTDSGSAGTGGDCTQGNAQRPKFSLTVFYDAPATPAAATPTTTTTTPATTASGTASTAGSSSTATGSTGG